MPELIVAYRDLGLGEPRPFLILTVTGPGGAKGPIPGFEFEINPCFVEGCQLALWGRKDLMKHFEVKIMERRKQFSLTQV